MAQIKRLHEEIQQLLAQNETPAAIAVQLAVPVSWVYDSIHLHELHDLLDPATVDL